MEPNLKTKALFKQHEIHLELALGMCPSRDDNQTWVQLLGENQAML